MVSPKERDKILLGDIRTYLKKEKNPRYYFWGTV